jgi:IS30 family transposase
MQIQPNERDKIAFYLGNKLSIRMIAKQLNHSPSSISDEVRRNSYHGIYTPINAQTRADFRKRMARRRHFLKDKETAKYVIEKLNLGWSPELIDGRLRLEKGYRVISYECIYQYIYSKTNRNKKLWKLLTLKRKKRQKKEVRKVARVRIPNQVSIHLRGETIDSRKTFCHYEGDSIIGKQTKSKIIHTEVERQTRYLFALVVNSKTSIDTVNAQMKIFNNIPVFSVTTDNGLEFAKHEQLNRLGIKTFFADPYCSGQRGTNENTNGLIRRYLPKKTSFDDLSQTKLNAIVWRINNRPKKVLKFLTPQEAFYKQLSINQGVRIES